jgi:hypothetical protein
MLSEFLATIGSFLTAVAFGWIVWSGFANGRMLNPIGPERRTAPVSFWLFQAGIALMGLLFLAFTLLRGWALAVVMA